MRHRLLVSLAVVGLLAACDAASDAPGRAAVSGAPPARFIGMYEVTGVTTDVESGDTRRIAGTVIVAGEGRAHSATFNLTTEFPGPEGPVKADLIGTGEGKASDSRLEGSAETQMFLAAIPGVDPKFPWIPGRLGPRIQSRFVMSPGSADDFAIEIETRGAPGPEGRNYGRTRTTLRAIHTTPPLADAS